MNLTTKEALTMARYTLNLSEVCEPLSGLNFNELEGNVSPDGWVAISQSAIANLDQARIFLDGVEATSVVDGTWTTDLYQLKVDEDGTRLVIASLA